MDISSAKWLSELEMDDPPFSYPYPITPLDYSIDELTFHSSKSCSTSDRHQHFDPQPAQYLSGGSIETSQNIIERPTKQLKTTNCNTTNQFITPKHSYPSSPSPASSHLISFGTSSNSPPATGMDSTIKPKNQAGTNENVISLEAFEDQHGSTYYGKVPRRTGGISRDPIQAQDHVIAERKRREKLSQKFIALSAVIPGLKKMDKASVLADAIKYLKHLQERVKTLEEQAAKKTMESVVFIKKSQVYVDESSSSSGENSDSCFDQLLLPEIEARVSDKEVLIRIHCEKQKGCLVKILDEIEKLHLHVTNSSVLPFGSSTLDVTVVAQMDVNFSMPMKDLVRNLRQALLRFM